uniref:RING-type domain-containing protein n=1 Tax=Oryza nivara TaxID=4536 RepID=A0A0E0FZY1_ORYNI
MAMSPHDQHEHDPDHAHRSPSNGTAATSTIATNRWGPYSGAGDFASNMAVILAALLAALALALALNAAVRYLLRRHRRARQQPAAAAAAAEDPEKPPVQEADPPPPPPALVYSAAGTKLAGAAECAICLAEFVDGDTVRVMPCWCQEIPLESGLRFAQIKVYQTGPFNVEAANLLPTPGICTTCRFVYRGVVKHLHFLYGDWRDILACFVKGKKNTNS